jgi:hypothetical protein
MADRIELFEVEVPASTVLATPQTTDLTFQDGAVTEIEVVIPPGPSGLLGFQIHYSGQRIIPFRANTWFKTDNEVIKWPLNGYPTTGRWQFVAYNTDIYSHIVQIRMLVDEVSKTPAALPPLVPIAPGGEAEDSAPLLPEDIGEPAPIEEFAPEEASA